MYALNNGVEVAARKCHTHLHDGGTPRVSRDVHLTSKANTRIEIRLGRSQFAQLEMR
jgi:hypothetical protein